MSDGWGLLGLESDGWVWALLKAAAVTLALSVAGFALGAVLGSLAAAARLSRQRLLSLVADAYATIFRGVPDLLTIYFLYFGGSVALTTIGHWFGAQGFLGLPAFATGARLGLARAIDGMVVVELIMVAVGVGRLLLDFQGRFDAPAAYAVMLAVIAEAVLLTYAGRVLERRLLPWRSAPGVAA